MQARASVHQETSATKAAKPARKLSSEYFANEPDNVEFFNPAKFSWSFGNMAVSAGAESPSSPPGLPWSIQAKLEGSSVDDPMEHEADRIAEVMRAPNAISAAAPKVSSVHAALQRKAKIGFDLGKVRIHEPASRLISLSEAAANLQRERDVRQASILAHGARFRVPTTADLKALFASGAVPEDVLKKSVEVALNRMAEENRLKSKEPVADIMKKIFHAGTSPMSMREVFDEAAYEAAVDVGNREQVYQSVLDAESKVAAGDKPKLKTIMQDSMKLIDDSIADDADIKLVFGTKHAFAKAIYKKAKAAIQKAIDHMDEQITTDYNLDDPEAGLGGWALFIDPATGKPHVHFKSSVVKVTDEVKAKITIIHESCHLADPSVGDEGKYYGSPGFEAESDSSKATNAAHYEEVPMRILKLSRYKDATGNFVEFKPGTSVGGTPQTFPEKARTKADQVLRKAWDKAVDVFEFIREVRTAEVAGNHALFNARKARLMEISKLMHLTIHEQPAATATVNQVDVVLAEGVAHAMKRIKLNAPRQTLPFELKMPPLKVGFQPQLAPVMTQKLELKPVPGLGPTPAQELSEAVLTEDQAAARIVEGSIKDYGQLLGNYADDKKLVDWMVKEYGKRL